MRKAALDAIARLVDDQPNVIFIGSDLGTGVMSDAMERAPDRVLMEGIAEQHMVGMASGLALEGFVPYVHTIGTFLTRRALEQIIVDVALHSLPVRLVASGGGMVYAPLGPTHQAIDDFALMRAIPGMTVLAPIDPLEMTETIVALADWPHPAYIRVAKGGEPTVTSPGMSLGKVRYLRSGDDGLVITTGAVGHEVLQAADELSVRGTHITIAHVPTITPLDPNIFAMMTRFDSILVVEEHLPEGGLWTAIAETLMRSGLSLRVEHVSLPRQYADRYGSQSDHWKTCGLSSEHLVNKILEMNGDNQYG